LNKLTQYNDVFNGKRFYSKRLLTDEYATVSLKLLTAIIENNKNKISVLGQEQKEIIKHLKNLNAENKKQ